MVVRLLLNTILDWLSTSNKCVYQVFFMTVIHWACWSHFIKAFSTFFSPQDPFSRKALPYDIQSLGPIFTINNDQSFQCSSACVALGPLLASLGLVMVGRGVERGGGGECPIFSILRVCDGWGT